MTGDAHVVLARWPELVARVPFDCLIVKTATDAVVEELTAHPELARVRTLRLETLYDAAGPLTDRAFIALAACEHLTALEELGGHSFNLTNRGAKALIDSPHLAKLRSVTGYAYSRHRSGVSLTLQMRERLNERFNTFALY